jgi:CRISPR/Cas system-associated endonuclease Cas1
MALILCTIRAVIFCDERHLPYSTILPISEGNNLHQKILKQQINTTEPVRKNLWKQNTDLCR